MGNRQTLFVSGVARSGTTALVNVLNQHPRILVGTERFFGRIKNQTLTQDMFAREAFLFPKRERSESQGFHLDGQDLVRKFNCATAIGDKFPGLYRHFDYMFDTFPEATHIYIFRNPFSVLESFEARKERAGDNWSRGWRAGLEEWNESLGKVAALPDDRLEKFLFLPYEDVLSSAERMNLIFAGLGLHGLPAQSFEPIIQTFRELALRKGKRRERMRREVGRSANWAAYARISDLADAQAARLREQVALDAGQRIAGE